MGIPGVQTLGDEHGDLASTVPAALDVIVAAGDSLR
jgi:hypothetical protein